MKLITNSDPMSKKRIVIASHALDEAITNCVINNKELMGDTITVVSLHDLMFEYEIFDEFGDFIEKIRWYKNATECVSNTDHFLLNRVLYVPDELFKHFTVMDKEYARRELEAYIGFSFNAFTGVGNQSPNGFCGEVVSLPQQWQIVGAKLNLPVPNYYWGPPDNNHLHINHRLVYSSIFNFLHWKISSVIPVEGPVFCFEKPSGEPVFILSIGSKHLITSSTTLSIEMKEKLTKLANKINGIFNCFISEILIFIEGATLCFGCMNHEVIRSKINTDFDDFVCNNLINEFYKCAS